jgi:hypothetical protein
MQQAATQIDWTFLLIHLGTYLCLAAAILLVLRWTWLRAPVLEDCRWCGALFEPGHTLCPQCRAKHDSKPSN